MTVSIVDLAALPWTDVGKAGIRQKVVRADREAGTFLGLIAFEPLIRTGLHRHLGPAASVFLAGALVDHQGEARAGHVGINLPGATHDAVAYRPTLLFARLDGPVIYASAKDLSELHAGARHGGFEGPSADRPDLLVAPQDLAARPTGIAGLRRKLVFDYHSTGADRRLVELNLAPATVIPAHVAAGAIDMFLLAGDLVVNGRRAAGPAVLSISPGQTLAVGSDHGCRLFAWVDGPGRWSDGLSRPDVYGH